MSHYVYYAVVLRMNSDFSKDWTVISEQKDGFVHRNFDEFKGPFKTKYAAEFFAYNETFCNDLSIEGIEDYSRTALANWIFDENHPIVVSWAGYSKRIYMHRTPINKRTVAKIMKRECFVPLTRDSKFTYRKALAAG